MFSPSSDHCILPDCDRETHCRGVCKTDYIAATRLVKSGATSWEELERLGVVNPPQQRFTLRSRVAIALEEAREAVAKKAKRKPAASHRTPSKSRRSKSRRRSA